MEKVFVSGSWDMLHSGHITFLKEASRYGDLFVGIGSDHSIEKYKGKKPVCCQEERLFMVKSIRYVKDAFINSGEGPVDFIHDILSINPDMLIVNEEQASEQKENLCLQYGIAYIVLKRTQEPALPARSTSSYRKLL
jgi:cytidyltransferase-like protein